MELLWDRGALVSIIGKGNEENRMRSGGGGYLFECIMIL